MSEDSKGNTIISFVKELFYLIITVIALGQIMASFMAFLARNALIIIAVLVIGGLVVYRLFFYKKKPPSAGGGVGDASDYF